MPNESDACEAEVSAVSVTRSSAVIMPASATTSLRADGLTRSSPANGLDVAADPDLTKKPEEPEVDKRLLATKSETSSEENEDLRQGGLRSTKPFSLESLFFPLSPSHLEPPVPPDSPYKKPPSVLARSASFDDRLSPDAFFSTEFGKGPDKVTLTHRPRRSAKRALRVDESSESSGSSRGDDSASTEDTGNNRKFQRLFREGSSTEDMGTRRKLTGR